MSNDHPRARSGGIQVLKNMVSQGRLTLEELRTTWSEGTSIHELRALEYELFNISIQVPPAQIARPVLSNGLGFLEEDWRNELSNH